MTSDVRGQGNQEAWHISPAHRHLVQFYESQDYLLIMLSQFVSTTLRNGEAGIVVATQPHIERLNKLLHEMGIDVDAGIASGQYVAYEATSAMQKFMVDGEPEPAKFRDVFGTIIADVGSKWPSVRIFGEMVALTAEVNYATATVDLENLWNELLETHDFSLCCAYPLSTFRDESMAGMLRDICEQHSAVFPAESFSTLESDADRLREIALLQQKATQLEYEVRQRASAQERLREALEAEQSARQQAEEALRIRDEFMSIAAHELKTPLTSLIGRAQLARKRVQMSNGSEPAQVENLIDSVVTQAQKLSRLISQLLDVSRLKGGKLSIERQQVDLVGLIHESVNSVYIGSNGHTITVRAPETMYAEVDPIRLEQVITNLLNNAVKYSPPESEVVVKLDWPNAHTIELSVQDQGPGIPCDEREQIFDRFYQGGLRSSPGGMGLGLYISREIIELHGGDVMAEFPDAGGSRFVVRLPLSPYQSVTGML